MKAAAKAPQKPQAEGGGSGTGNGDNSELREALMSNVVMDSPNVSWDDVCGKSSPKEWVSFARSSLRSRALPRPLSLSSLPRGSMWTVKPPPVRANERGNGPRDLCAFGPLAHPTSRFTKIQRGGPVKHTHLNTTVASWQERRLYAILSVFMMIAETTFFASFPPHSIRSKHKTTTRHGRSSRRKRGIERSCHSPYPSTTILHREAETMARHLALWSARDRQVVLGESSSHRSQPVHIHIRLGVLFGVEMARSIRAACFGTLFISP